MLHLVDFVEMKNLMSQHTSQNMNHRLLDVKLFHHSFNENVNELIVEHSSIKQVKTDKGVYTADGIVSGADYHFTEQHLLPEAYRSYAKFYWNKIRKIPLIKERNHYFKMT